MNAIAVRLAALPFGICALAAAAGDTRASAVAQWDFNGGSTTTVPGGTASPAPAAGAGTASLVGGATATFASGAANGGSSDPVTTSPPNYAWNTAGYPAQGTNSGTAGVRFDVSTVGVAPGELYVQFDVRPSNTASRFLRVDYTTDGSTFTPAPNGVFEATAGGEAWHRLRQVDLGADPLVFNNASFGFRLVTVFDPAASAAYTAAAVGSTYATNGTLRYDMVTLSTTPVPEPASAAAAGVAIVGLGALLARRLAGSRA